LNFDYYIAEVICGGLKHLKKIQHILPAWQEGESEEVAQKRWDGILDDITYTFEKAMDIMDHDLIYVPSKDWTEELYQKNLKITEEMNEKYYDKNDKKYEVMIKDEVDRYERGWKFFQTYFFSLWD